MSTVNPFEELYVGEMIPPHEFVDLFSSVLLAHSRPLFQQGNVVVKGVYGSGKTMLLSLLKPEVRLAYAARGEQLPLPPELNKFVGAGISIGRSGALEFGRYRHADEDLACELFGDFLNYRLADDLLSSVAKLGGNELVATSLGMSTDRRRLDSLARAIAGHRCWLGYLDGVRSLPDLHARVDARIRLHQASLRARGAHPDDLISTTTSVGEPLAVIAEALAEFDVIDEQTRVYLRIDEYDKLTTLSQVPSQLGLALRSVINAAISVRDPRVFYRIGTRPYGWRESALSVFRSTDTLMQDRDYAVVDIDQILGRSEYRPSPVFEQFAGDVFERRLKWCGLIAEGSSFSDVQVGSAIERVLGRTPSTAEKAAGYIGPASTTRGLSLENDWPADWREYLFGLAEEQPLDAKIGEAWLRRQVGTGATPTVPGDLDVRPWTSPSWWASNRRILALVHIAARTRERLIWHGSDDVLRLSGDHILAFLSICRNIWEVWARSGGLEDAADNERRAIGPVPPLVQSVGINTASDSWFKRIAKMPRGDTRQLFISELATALKRSLMADGTLSHPGYNGISLTLLELSNGPDVRQFLDDAADWGDLIEKDHTGMDRAQRRKYYIAPLLSPKFQLPVERRQEPRYVAVDTVRRLMRGLPVDFDVVMGEPNQLPLFEDREGE